MLLVLGLLRNNYKIQRKDSGRRNYAKIYIKNLNTGVLVAITKTIYGNTLTIKQTKSRLYKNNYRVYIPAEAIKDSAGNNLQAAYSFQFKTG